MKSALIIRRFQILSNERSILLKENPTRLADAVRWQIRRPRWTSDTDVISKETSRMDLNRASTVATLDSPGQTWNVP